MALRHPTERGVVGEVVEPKHSVSGDLTEDAGGPRGASEHLHHGGRHPDLDERRGVATRIEYVQGREPSSGEVGTGLDEAAQHGGQIKIARESEHGVQQVLSGPGDARRHLAGLLVQPLVRGHALSSCSRSTAQRYAG
jgi:hypothetical protein